ncbi:MAG: hypothetical protein HY422_01020 [Candidatus Komeilibacteria bacterium]|nr:hypothetical protein [Candidatus Komeilibacteria bacterium]
MTVLYKKTGDGIALLTLMPYDGTVTPKKQREMDLATIEEMRDDEMLSHLDLATRAAKTWVQGTEPAKR